MASLSTKAKTFARDLFSKFVAGTGLTRVPAVELSDRDRAQIAYRQKHGHLYQFPKFNFVGDVDLDPYWNESSADRVTFHVSENVLHSIDFSRDPLDDTSITEAIELVEGFLSQPVTQKWVDMIRETDPTAFDNDLPLLLNSRFHGLNGCHRFSDSEVILTRLPEEEGVIEELILHAPTRAEDEFQCCLCDGMEEGYGNNPAPLSEDGRCCCKCNVKVIEARLFEKAHPGGETFVGDSGDVDYASAADVVMNDLKAHLKPEQLGAAKAKVIRILKDSEAKAQLGRPVNVAIGLDDILSDPDVQHDGGFSDIFSDVKAEAEKQISEFAAMTVPQLVSAGIEAVKSPLMSHQSMAGAKQRARAMHVWTIMERNHPEGITPAMRQAYVEAKRTFNQKPDFVCDLCQTPKKGSPLPFDVEEEDGTTSSQELCGDCWDKCFKRAFDDALTNMTKEPLMVCHPTETETSHHGNTIIVRPKQEPRVFNMLKMMDSSQWRDRVQQKLAEDVEYMKFLNGISEKKLVEHCVKIITDLSIDAKRIGGSEFTEYIPTHGYRLDMCCRVMQQRGVLLPMEAHAIHYQLQQSQEWRSTIMDAVYNTPMSAYLEIQCCAKEAVARLYIWTTVQFRQNAKQQKQITELKKVMANVNSLQKKLTKSTEEKAALVKQLVESKKRTREKAKELEAFKREMEAAFLESHADLIAAEAKKLKNKEMIEVRSAHQANLEKVKKELDEQSLEHKTELEKLQKAAKSAIKAAKAKRDANDAKAAATAAAADAAAGGGGGGGGGGKKSKGKKGKKGKKKK